MADETKTDPKPMGALVALAPLFSFVKLDWFKALLNNVGGRKVGVCALTVYGVLELAKANVLVGWQLVGGIAALAFIGAVTVFAIAWEDRAKAAAGKGGAGAA